MPNFDLERLFAIHNYIQNGRQPPLELMDPDYAKRQQRAERRRNREDRRKAIIRRVRRHMLHLMHRPDYDRITELDFLLFGITDDRGEDQQP